MNSVLIESHSITDETSTLSDEQGQHLTENVRIQIGDKLKGTILEEGLCELEVIQLAPKVIVKITSRKSGLHFPIELIVGASRPPTMKKLFEHATAMGANSFQILKANLSDKSYLSSKIYERFEELAHLGLSQSAVFYKVPKLSKVYKIEPSIKAQQKIILSPYTTNKLKDVKIDISQPLQIAIGPERGWTNKELDLFKEQGFKEVNIGPSIMRVENATIAIMGQLNQLMN